MNKILSLIRPDLRHFNPYSSARDEAKKGKIWLNANESPFSPDFQDGESLNRYPDKQPTKLISLLSELYQVKPSQVVMSRGSDEVIDLLVRLFCRAGLDAIMTCSPTFGMYAVCAQIQGASIIDVPLVKENGYQLNLASIQAAWGPHVKLIFVCSPNNPTGNLINVDDILQLCKFYEDKSIVVVDEAYIEFANTISLSNCIEKCKNLVILRTFSKAYGIAGARCGVLMAQDEIVEWIVKIMAPYPLSSMAIKTIENALNTKRLLQIREEVKCITAERKRLTNCLKNLPFVVKIYPSAANFILLEVHDAEKVMKTCYKKGIVLRDMSKKPGLLNHVRISVGTPDENDQLVQILQRVK